MNDSDDPGPRRPELDTGEFFLPGSGLSALLIHGLTGTPYEMRHLGERLAGAGVRVLGVRLAGHARTPEEMGAVGHRDWYESVIEGFERARGFGDPIVAVGLSAGAVLAARLAEDQGAALTGLVMLSPAFFLKPSVRLAIGIAGLFRGWARLVYLQGSESDIYDRAARATHPSTRLMPLSAALALAELSAMVRAHLQRVTQPVLIIHSRRDHVCPMRKNVTFLLARLGSPAKRAVILEESFHVITVDSEKDRVADEVIDFIAPLHSTAARMIDTRRKNGRPDYGAQDG